MPQRARTLLAGDSGAVVQSAWLLSRVAGAHVGRVLSATDHGSLAPGPRTTRLVFLALGIGMAAIVPVMFGAVGRLPGASSGVSLATATMPGYAGSAVRTPAVHTRTPRTGRRCGAWSKVNRRS